MLWTRDELHMYPNYGSGLESLGKLAALIGIMLLLLSVFNFIMRKVLHVERRKFFSYNHMNESHKKGDRVKQTASIIAIVLVWIIMINNRDLVEKSPWILLGVTVGFGVIQEGFRALMEWKYKQGQNDYLYTIYQLVFILAVLYVTLKTEGFGLFDFW